LIIDAEFLRDLNNFSLFYKISDPIVLMAHNICHYLPYGLYFLGWLFTYIPNALIVATKADDITTFSKCSNDTYTKPIICSTSKLKSVS